MGEKTGLDMEAIADKESKEREKKKFDMVVIALGNVVPEQAHEKPFLRQIDDEHPQRYLNPDEKLEQTPIHMSSDAILTAYSTGLLWEAGFQSGAETMIIFTGGKTAGEDFPSEAEAMKKYLLFMFPNIPEDSIILEDKAYSTTGNAEYTKEFLDDLKENEQIDNDISPILLTRGFHTERAATHFDAFGVKNEPMADEDVIDANVLEILGEADTRDEATDVDETIEVDEVLQERQKFVDKVFLTKPENLREQTTHPTLSDDEIRQIIQERAKHEGTEKFLRLYAQLDPKGKFSDTLARLARHGKLKKD